MKATSVLLSFAAAAGYASACLRTSLRVSFGLEVIVTLDTVDNGVSTCSGNREGLGEGINRGDIKCIDGYSLHYELTSNGARCTYGTPHGELTYLVESNRDCKYSNCCGGMYRQSSERKLI